MMNRRDFIKIAAVVGAAGAAAKLGFPPGREGAAVRETRVLMGTVVQLTVRGGDPRQARRAAGACFEAMAGLEGLLSRFQPGSQVSLLNRSGSLIGPHPVLRGLVEQSLALYRLTDGRFDITVLPAVQLYQDFQREGRGLPSGQDLDRVLPLVGSRGLEMDDDRIRFQRPGMGVTLDGIAKGAVVEGGVEALRRSGCSRVLVEAGGDLLARGGAEGRPWRVGVQNPRAGGDPILTRLEIRDQAAATSGDYLRAFRSDYGLHHILSPRSGVSRPDLASATVVCPDPARADGLATALMTMSPEEALALVEDLPETEAFLVTKQLHTLASSGLPLV